MGGPEERKWERGRNQKSEIDKKIGNTTGDLRRSEEVILDS